MRTGLRGQLSQTASRGPELRIIGTTESVRRAGVRTYAMRELDRIFASMPGIQDAAAFEIPGGPLGQRIGAAIVPEAASPPTSRGLAPRHRRSTGIHPTCLPEKLVVLQAIPRTAGWCGSTATPWSLTVWQYDPGYTVK
jgi:non-ribosomal peptide synthetase component E (peptide arylation enzyme)